MPARWYLILVTPLVHILSQKLHLRAFFLFLSGIVLYFQAGSSERPVAAGGCCIEAVLDAPVSTEQKCQNKLGRG
jgi:hypothetical protein